MRELFGEIDARDFTDKDLGRCGNLKARELCDLRCALTDDLGIERTVYDDSLADKIRLLRGEDVTSAGLEFFPDLVVDLVCNDDRLLGSADHAVIKGLGVNDRIDGEHDVCRFVDDRGSISCSDTDRGLARRVSGLDHTGTSGSKDDVGFLHNEIRHVKARLVDPAYDTLGSACRYSRIEHDLCCFDSRLGSSRVRAYYDTVACLECKESFENSCRCRVCCRDNCGDHADRLCDLSDPCGFVFFDDATSLRIPVLIVDILCGIVVLNDLVFGKSHACFLCCHDGERESCFASRDRSCSEDSVNFFLTKLRILRLCGPDVGELSLKPGYAVHFFTCYFHKHLPFIDLYMI